MLEKIVLQPLRSAENSEVPVEQAGNDAIIPCNEHKAGIVCIHTNRRICGATPCFFDYRPAQHQ